MPMERRVATRREAADYLRVTERYVDKLRHDGRLKSFKIGKGGVRFWLSDLDALMGARR
jgi:excisionase family DNA binding protein